jgi:hypothetical protein
LTTDHLGDRGEHGQPRRVVEFRIRSGEVAGLDNEARIPQPSVVAPTPTAGPTATATTAAWTDTRADPRVHGDDRASPSGNNINSGVPVTSRPRQRLRVTAYSWTFPLGTPGTSTVAGPVVTFSIPNNTVGHVLADGADIGRPARRPPTTST